jgi:hypothetical protein
MANFANATDQQWAVVLMAPGHAKDHAGRQGRAGRTKEIEMSDKYPIPWKVVNDVYVYAANGASMVVLGECEGADERPSVPVDVLVRIVSAVNASPAYEAMRKAVGLVIDATSDCGYDCKQGDVMEALKACRAALALAAQLKPEATDAE